MLPPPRASPPASSACPRVLVAFGDIASARARVVCLCAAMRRATNPWSPPPPATIATTALSRDDGVGGLGADAGGGEVRPLPRNAIFGNQRERRLATGGGDGDNGDLDLGEASGVGCAASGEGLSPRLFDSSEGPRKALGRFMPTHEVGLGDGNAAWPGVAGLSMSPPSRESASTAAAAAVGSSVPCLCSSSCCRICSWSC